MKFKYMIFLFIICIFTAFLLSSSLFEIKEITVAGNKNVPREDIIRLSSIYYGENIFRINKKNSMKGIFQNPYIKMIKITRYLPDKVRVDIIERQIMALVPYVGSYLNIDEEGMVVEVNQLVKKKDLPVVKGLKFSTFKVGELLSIENKEQLGITISIIKEIKSAGLVNQISEIDVTNIGDIKLKTANGNSINLGSKEDINYKISFAKTILADVAKQNVKGTIELGNKGNPVFRPE